MTKQIELTAIEIAPLAPSESVAVRPVPQDDGAQAVDLEGDGLVPSSSIVDPFRGAGSAPFSESAQKVLRSYHHVPDEWIGIRPEGHIYLSYRHAVDIFDEAFGFGGWSMVPVGQQFQVERVPKTDRKGSAYELVTLYREYRFYCLGRFVRQAMGAGDYRTNNPSMNLSDAAEMCESYALNRMAKRFRIAAQCWDSEYAERWKARFAYQDSDGNWKKKTNLGAGAPAAIIPSTSPNPQQSAQTSSAPAPPQSSNFPPIYHDKIVLTNRKRTTKGADEWRAGGVRQAMFIDASGAIWRFIGDAIDVAATAVEQGAPLIIQWTTEIDGKYKNKVVRAAALVGGE